MIPAFVKSGLPIDEILPALRATLARHRNAVVEAPPGAGKSTVVPIALLDEPWLRGGKIVMLEPRRLATRAVATRMATTLGEAPGETIGYRMRLETRVSRRTRIEVVTEGVFTRMLQSDPALDGVAAVLFDEFHERSLHADTGLAFALDSQENLSPELRLLVMSATLDGAAVARLLGDAPVITAAGRRFPVEIHHVGTGMPLLPGGRESPELGVLRVIKRALNEAPGDLLVFLPGAGEIRRVQGMLTDVGSDVDVMPLFGELAPAAQDAALRPAAPGRRKIVLATNIAETSLTIDGVRVVIDAGLERRSLFDPSSGMNRLEVQRISRASAEQRAGRAGRTAPGVCFRLWGEGAERSLAAYAPPEVCVADLGPLALDLAVWGTEANSLRWLDPPPAATLASARDLLRRLGALDDAGKVTAHGRAMQEFPAHPRLAHMLLKAREMGASQLAAELAALLSDRDLLRAGTGPRERDSDVRTRLEALRRGTSNVDRGALERVRRAQRSFEQQLDAGGKPRSTHDKGSGDVDAGVLLGLAYPDRIARRRPGAEARYQLSNGRGALFAAAESIAREEFIVAVDLDDREREAQIRLAAPLAKADLLAHFAAQLRRADELVWDARAEAVAARRVIRFDELLIEEKPLNDVPRAASAAAMLEGVRSMGFDALPWDEDSRAFLARCEFVRKLARTDLAGWPETSKESLALDLTWLEPFLDGITRRSQLTRVPLLDALRARLSYEQQRKLDQLAPTHIGLPTGSQVRIDYLDDNAPVASMRMQEVFGLAATPRIGGGAVPVTFTLLSPGRKPLQITRDLASFWRNAYIDVRKDMRGRYPRHYWPENPLEAEPTRRAKPRG
ncbi:MAG TPA: ATP-dependent helicase HrpB [Steroidobacteraceae bacterium]|jgi:ATP-dependent helicase HrpB|nr:ATP-dependent helicase HrpB [Steroidobacteraceae bacterium]